MPPFPNMDGTPNNAFSPLQTRNLPPMTPSMPGFIFNAYPETPPIHSHFLSPGLGPFSPGIPTSPGGFQYNPFINSAPGAPINRYQQAGSAALGTPTTQAFPNPNLAYPRSGMIGGIAGSSDVPQQSMGQVLSDYFPTVAMETIGESSRNGDEQNETSQPSSPTLRVSKSTTLNAQDRLAPSTSNAAGSLPDLTLNMRDIRLNGAEITRDPEPLSPIGGSGRMMGHKKSSSGFDLTGSLKPDDGERGAGGSGVGVGRDGLEVGRASMDGLRPGVFNLGMRDWAGIVGQSERRASFGDAAREKDK
jgi:hypothetical protein